MNNDKIYCIHCKTKNNRKDKYCVKCKKKLFPIEEEYLKFIRTEVKTKVKGNIEDNIFNFLIAFIRSHLYGVVVSIFVVGFIATGTIMNKVYSPDNVVKYSIDPEHYLSEAYYNNDNYFDEIDREKEYEYENENTYKLYEFNTEYTDPNKLIEDLIVAIVGDIRNTGNSSEFKEKIQYINHYNDLTQEEINNGANPWLDNSGFRANSILSIGRHTSDAAYFEMNSLTDNIYPIHVTGDYKVKLLGGSMEPDFGEKNSVFNNFEELKLYLILLNNYDCNDSKCMKKKYKDYSEKNYVRIVKRDGLWYFLYATEDYEGPSNNSNPTYLDKEDLTFYKANEASTDNRKNWKSQVEKMIQTYY